MKANGELFLLAFAVVTACGGTNQNSQAGPTSLKEAFKNDFLIGAAINRSQFYGEDKRGVPIIQGQFNSITPENVLKWQLVHPLPGKFDFAASDRYVEFGESNHMFIIGHTLIWHHQTPRWVFEDEDGNSVDRGILLQRMREHILTVVGRYRDRIKGWDVVNEALNDDGTLRESAWRKLIGDDYIEKAFQFAHEADPQAQLHYNDYALENIRKRHGAIALIKKLQAEGIPITAVGLQEHVKMDWPSTNQVDETISDFARLGVKVMITELDVDVVAAAQANRTADVTLNARTAINSDEFAAGLPAARQQALARRYADLFRIYLKHRADISRVTFWGVTDGDSWLNSPHRTNYPLLFDRAGNPKPAFEEVLRVAPGR